MLRSTALGEIAIQTGLVNDATARLMVASHEAVAPDSNFEEWALGARFLDDQGVVTLRNEFAVHRYICDTCQTTSAGNTLVGERDLECPVCHGHNLRSLTDDEDSRLTMAGNRQVIVARPNNPNSGSSSSTEMKSLKPGDERRGLGNDPLNRHMPRMIGQWQILGEVGRGATGCVYRALDNSLDRLVAIKVLHSSAPSHTERFAREARAAARLDHRGIVSIYDNGMHEGRPFLVMEFVDGRSLREVVVNDGPMPVEDALETAIQVADALQAAHVAGIVHRDVKPANIMTVSGQRGIKVTDFGLARLLDASVRLTSPGAILGTPLFMAPEQVQDEAITPATDVYGLGASLYWLMAGEPPFKTGTHLMIMHQHVTEPFPSLMDKVPGMVRGIDKVLAKMCAKRPADRYQSMAEAANAMALALLDANESSGRMPTLEVLNRVQVPTPPSTLRQAVVAEARSLPVEVVSITGALDAAKWKLIEDALQINEPGTSFHLVLDFGECRSVANPALGGLLRATETLSNRGAKIALARMHGGVSGLLQPLLLNSNCIAAGSITDGVSRVGG
ncbi:MAG: protein kinase [Planctomycetota bacterium]